MSTKDNRCRNCRADIAIHRHTDYACPAVGKEAAVGAEQLWLSTTFQPEEDTTKVKTLEARVARLEKRVADQDIRLKETGTLARRMKQLEAWQSDLAIRLVNVDRRQRKQPLVRVKPAAKKARP